MTNKSGQALLIVLLAMATISTLVLSIVSRSVSEVEVTSREEESLRAFSAAEAGIEEALVSGDIGTQVAQDLEVPSGTGQPSLVGNYQADVTGFPEVANEYAYPFNLFSGDSAAVWFVTRDGDQILPCGSNPCFGANDIELCWGNKGTNPASQQAPAVEVTVIYEEPVGTYRTTKTAFDPVVSRRGVNGFSTTSGGACTIAGEEYAFTANIDLPSLGIATVADRLKLMKVKLLYNTAESHSFGVASSGDFPIQGKKVSSTGQSGSASRKINAYLINPTVPSIFESAVFSSSGIAK